jgi:cytochrome c-type biogenesis protein
MEGVSLLAALGGGIASFLCPCHISLIPVYLASLTGPELGEGSTPKRLPVFLHSLFFVLGLGVFLSLIFSLGAMAGDFLNNYAGALPYISGGLIVLLGLYMLLSLRFPRLNYECHLPPAGGVRAGYFRSFIIGATYSLVHVPCITPVLLAIIMMGISSGNIWQAGGLMAVYFVGYGLPFLLAGAALGAAMPLLKKISQHRDALYTASGLLLIGVGIIILLR